MLHPEAVIHYITRHSRIARLTGASVDEVKRAFRELDATQLWSYCEDSLRPYRNLPLGTTLERMKAPTLYVVCRLLRPKVVVETGVASGVSSTFILKALEDNHYGQLYSVDLPCPDIHGVILPPDKDAGWIIPGQLKARWHFIVGKSTQVLPSLMAQLDVIDVFFHDSEHTYDNVMFELQTVFPHMRSGGVMMIDNVNMNNAIKAFSKSHNLKPVYLFDFAGLYIP